MNLPTTISANWEQILPALLGISVLYARLEALAIWLAKRAGALRLVARMLRLGAKALQRIANALDDTAKGAADGKIDAADIAQVVRDLTTDQSIGGA